MPEAFICDAIHTPSGRLNGALSTVRADDLAAVPLRVLAERNPDVDWSRVDDCLMGCANQAGEDNRNVARTAVLLAGLPVRCRASRSLSDAGRTLFAASRRQRTSTNDADRLRKYLARFDLSWPQLA